MADTPSPYFIKRNPPPQDGPIELSQHMEVDEQPSALREYWYVLKRHRWLIGSFTAAVLACVALYTFTATPIYTAQATILLERKAPQVLKIQDALSESIENVEYYKTQYEILKSRALAARVIKDQALDKEPLFTGETGEEAGFIAGLLDKLMGAGSEDDSQENAKEEAATGVKSRLINAYQSMIKIAPVPGTGMVRVAYSTPDKTLSTRLANAHATAYVRYGIDVRSNTNEEALAFLEKKALELKERVEASEASLNTYRRDKGIISLSDKENIVVDRLSDLNKLLTEAEALRISLEAKVRAIRSGNVNALPSDVNSPVIQGLKNELTRLEGEHVQLSKEFKPGYPPLDKVTAQLENTRLRIRTEMQNELRSIEAAYRAAVNQEAQFRVRMQEQKNETLKLKDSAVEYAILEREVNTNRQLYDSVLQRMREMSVASDVRSPNVYVVDKAEVPLFPSYPDKRRTLLLGLLLGLAGGIGLAFLREHLDSTFKNAEDLERYIGLPHLAVIPDLMRLSHRNNGYVSKVMGTAKNGKTNLPAKVSRGEIITEHHPLSVVAEAYRTLRSALLLARANEPARTVLVTSATAGEGKTTTLMNTAIVFAQMRARVLIIDADLRRPRCHKLLKVENDIGLSEVLAGHVPAEKVIKATRVENLFTISSGGVPPNPAELLGSPKMAEVLEALKKQFEYIFIDSSPVLPVTDAVLLATMVDGVLLIVDGEHTPRQVLKTARLRLTNPRIKILGVLLNRVDILDGNYAGYYGQYYDYYGQDEQEKESA